MFPRRFFAGRFFAPRFFPQSSGGAAAARQRERFISVSKIRTGF